MSIKLFEAVMLAGGDALELRMYGRIGAGIFEDGITAQSVSDALAAAGPRVRTLNVKLSSPGGSAWDGLAIRSMLAAHPAHVNVDVEGLAASAASIVAMAGDTIRMHEGAAMMVHGARSFTDGTIEDHQRAIQRLETCNDGAATLYATRTGKSKDECAALMAAETWLTPAQAKDLGFVDEIVPGKSPAPAMAFDLAPYQYRNIPPQLAAAMKEPLTMSYARIALALGLSESAQEADVMAAVSGLQQSITRRDPLMAELRVITGKQADGEVIAAVKGMQAATERLATMQAEVEKREALLEEQAHAALIEKDKHDPKGRKLTPAMMEWAKTQSSAELAAFLEVAPHQLRMVPPAATGGAGGVTAAGSGGQPRVVAPDNAETALTYQGKTWMQLKPMEKHRLHESDPELFAALKREHEQQSGASAS